MVRLTDPLNSRPRVIEHVFLLVLAMSQWSEAEQSTLIHNHHCLSVCLRVYYVEK